MDCSRVFVCEVHVNTRRKYFFPKIPEVSMELEYEALNLEGWQCRLRGSCEGAEV